MQNNTNQDFLADYISRLITTPSNYIKINTDLTYRKPLYHNGKVFYAPGNTGTVDISYGQVPFLQLKTIDYYKGDLKAHLTPKNLIHYLRVWVNPTNGFANLRFLAVNGATRGILSQSPYVRDLEEYVRYTDAAQFLTPDLINDRVKSRITCQRHSILTQDLL